MPSLSQKYLVLPSRGVLAVGSTVFVLEAVFVNLSRPFGYQPARFVGLALAFAVLLFSFGYVALQMVFTNERRLLAIENELAIARQLQFSILPTTTPELRNLRIAAVYQPMTAVAGDFYEYLPVDEYRAGFLVADVSGHGVPAALIASMIKVATQSVVSFANDPSELLRRLRQHLVSAVTGAFCLRRLPLDRHRNSHGPLLCGGTSAASLLARGRRYTGSHRKQRPAIRRHF